MWLKAVSPVYEAPLLDGRVKVSMETYFWRVDIWQPMEMSVLTAVGYSGIGKNDFMNEWMNECIYLFIHFYLTKLAVFYTT
jgi:hypothetical protein